MKLKKISPNTHRHTHTHTHTDTHTHTHTHTHTLKQMLKQKLKTKKASLKFKILDPTIENFKIAYYILQTLKKSWLCKNLFLLTMIVEKHKGHKNSW